MGDLSKEQEQAIARSTMYLVAAVLSILMIFYHRGVPFCGTRTASPAESGDITADRTSTGDRSPHPAAMDPVEKA